MKGIFQFTPLHERRQRKSIKDRRRRISIHASTREATNIPEHLIPFQWLFQFMPLHERQRMLLLAGSAMNAISIHASTWEATIMVLSQLVWIKYFNSCLYIRGDRDHNQRQRIYQISIHASIWEATDTPQALRNKRYISIHASTREATYASKADKTTADISIHASTWEATYKRGTPCICVLISIHASTWEATTESLKDLGVVIFQFMPLHERQRIAFRIPKVDIFYFNSRLYMRGNAHGTV